MDANKVSVDTERTLSVSAHFEVRLLWILHYLPWRHFRLWARCQN